MKEIEVEFPLANINLDSVIRGVSERFALPLVRRGLTHVKDSFLDTEDFKLLARRCSFRVRQKLEDIYRGLEVRLTFKYPLEDHEFLLIREELKLKTKVESVGQILEFFGGAAHAMLDQRFEVKLNVEESSTEVYLGKAGGILNVSYDRMRILDPRQTGSVLSENALEIEDHGIGRECLIEVKEFIEETYGLVPSVETKYCRGLRLLHLNPAVSSASEGA